MRVLNFEEMLAVSGGTGCGRRRPAKRSRCGCWSSGKDSSKGSCKSSNKDSGKDSGKGSRCKPNPPTPVPVPSVP
jgi:hypothetical protein